MINTDELSISLTRLVLRLCERTLLAPEKFSISSTRQISNDYRKLKKHLRNEIRNQKERESK